MSTSAKLMKEFLSQSRCQVNKEVFTVLLCQLSHEVGSVEGECTLVCSTCHACTDAFALAQSCHKTELHLTVLLFSPFVLSFLFVFLVSLFFPFLSCFVSFFSSLCGFLHCSPLLLSYSALFSFLSFLFFFFNTALDPSRLFADPDMEQGTPLHVAALRAANIWGRTANPEIPCGLQPKLLT